MKSFVTMMPPNRPSKILSRISAANRRLPTYLSSLDDDWRQNATERGGGGGQGGGGPRSVRSRPTVSGIATSVSRARGNNAIVVKVLSYGAGARSARNVLAYQAKEERACDQDGREISDIAVAVKEWSTEFSDRQGSKDVLLLTYELGSTGNVHAALDALTARGVAHDGDMDRTLAYSLPTGATDHGRLHVAVILASERKSRAAKGEGRRLPATLEIVHAIDGRITADLRDKGVEVSYRYPSSTASGGRGLTATLHRMSRDGADVHMSTKTQLTPMEGKAGKYERGETRRWIVATDTRSRTREGAKIARLRETRQPRDFMHLLLSGPADVDRGDFIKAGASFLRSEFGNHRYAYAVHNRHDLKAHPHIHVLVSMKDSFGRSMDPNIRDFTEWRHHFAQHLKERGIHLEPQKRNARAGPPPIKRWEWELFQRLGAAAPPSVQDKVLAKIRGRPTAPAIGAARERFITQKANLERIIKMLEEIGKDRQAPSTARELSQDLAAGLAKEFGRLQAAVERGRDPSKEEGKDHMLRNSPITAEQAVRAGQRIANAAAKVADKITDATERQAFEDGMTIVHKLVGLQLDARRVSKEKLRAGGQTTMSTSTTAGRDRLDENDTPARTSNNRAIDAARIEQAQDAQDHRRDELKDRKQSADREHDKEREQPSQVKGPTTIKMRPPRTNDRDRNR